MLLLSLLFTLLCVYSLVAVMFSRNIIPVPQNSNNWQPFVSIVIACKDEEDNLPHLFDSLKKLDYEQEKLEIIFINDASTDRSNDLIEQFKSTIPGIFLKTLSATEKKKPGKAGALLVGIEQCRGKVVFITDADCRVSPDWIRAILPAFQENIGVVGGYTYIYQPKSLFAQLQALDWQFSLCIASAASQMNRPITWVGNNLAILKSAYDKVGGYENLQNSFVEDFSLIDAIERSTQWNCRFYAAAEGAVKTQSLPSLLSLYNQRKRWAAGISGARPFGIFIMVVAFLTHIFLLAVLIVHPLCGLVSLGLKSWSDLRIFSKRTKVDLKSDLFKMVVFQIYYIVYCSLLPILFLFDKRIIWKGEEFRRL